MAPKKKAKVVKAKKADVDDAAGADDWRWPDKDSRELQGAMEDSALQDCLQCCTT